MFNKLKNFSNTSSSPEFLIVGLGNPGLNYELTRHNTGFLFVEALKDKYNFNVKKIKFKSLIGDATITNKRVIVMKPQTFMNESGKAVRECSDFYKIPPSKIIIVFDDTSLPVGAVRIKRSGTDGGHNGIKSIISHLGSNEFPRIKLGIGQKPHPDYDLADYVLSNFNKNEIPLMREAIEKAAEALTFILNSDIEKAMALYN